MIPMYNVVRNLGFHNTFAALVIPWIGEPFAMFMLKQFFDGIPRTLDEAAIIDGCSWFGVFRHVVIPNSKSILVTLALMQFLMSWDGFFWPLIAVESEALTVVQVAVSSMLDPDYIRWGWTFAAASVATVPILALFWLSEVLRRRYQPESKSSSAMEQKRNKDTREKIMSKTRPIILDCDPGHDDVLLYCWQQIAEIDLLGLQWRTRTIDKTTKTLLAFCT